MLEIKFATLVFPPTTKLLAIVVLPFNSVVFATYKLGPPELFKPVPVICRFAMFATPLTKRPSPVVFDDSIVPPTVKLF